MIPSGLLGIPKNPKEAQRGPKELLGGPEEPETGGPFLPWWTQDPGPGKDALVRVSLPVPPPGSTKEGKGL
jgi:hypothetical protein